MKLKLLALFIILLIAYASKAQTFTGCVVPNEFTDLTRIYVTEDGTTGSCSGGPNYSDKNYYYVQQPCIWEAETTTTPCSINGSRCGLKATYTKRCDLPLDNEVIAVVIIVAGLGFYFLRYKPFAI